MEGTDRGRAKEGQTSSTADGPDKPRKEIIPRPPKRREGEAWKASHQGMNRLWNNYRTVLITSFKRMSRSEQEDLVTKLCIIVTIGVTGCAFLLFYAFIPRPVRVFALPAAVFGAWWAGSKIVSAVVLARMEDVLNKE